MQSSQYTDSPSRREDQYSQETVQSNLRRTSPAHFRNQSNQGTAWKESPTHAADRNMSKKGTGLL
jgi:hypothetical protein